jgi:phosphopantetheinyl transferase
VSGPFEERVSVSVTHKGGRAVALARVGIDVGIDLERIEPRGEGFVQLAFAAGELHLLPSQDRDEWLTRLWCAKEAVGKALGTGLSGAPRDLVATSIDGDRVVVAGTPVRTRAADGYVIAWTEGEKT